MDIIPMSSSSNTPSNNNNNIPETNNNKTEDNAADDIWEFQTVPGKLHTNIII